MEFKENLEKLFNFLPPSLNSVKGKLKDNEGRKFGYEPYIQHIPELIEESQRVFIELCVKEGILSKDLINGKVHRQGIIGRYIDSSSFPYNYWNRFMCIDEKYREWNQPYYAFNLDKEGIDFKGYCIGVCWNNLSPELISFFRDKKIKTILSG